MSTDFKVAFLFPGQGAQYVGMAKEFTEHFAVARETFEEADDLLGRNLSKIILQGPEDELTQTKNSQAGIFVASVAILRSIKQSFPEIIPSICAGLSLGEYTALHASLRISFKDALELVQRRGQLMNEACELHPGGMSVVLGLSAEQVEKIVAEIHLPNDLWVANFNCPGQVVIAGSHLGIEMATAAFKEKGAKRVMPLQVHGAFHSGLMHMAEERLAPYIQSVNLTASDIELVMNVPGNFVSSLTDIRTNLIKQVTHSVRWEQGIRHIDKKGVDLYVEVGCGKALCGLNRKIGVLASTIGIENVVELKNLEQAAAKI